MTNANEMRGGRPSPAARWWVGIGAVWFLLAAGYTLSAGVDLLGRQEETIVRRFTTAQFDGTSAGQPDGEPAGQSADTLDTLDVRTDGDIIVIGADTDVVTVERRTTHGVKPFTADERVAGSTLSLSGDCPAMSSFCTVQFTVTVPRAMTVSARSHGNSIRVVGISGSVTADSGGGHLQVDDAKGAVTAISGGGEVRLRRLSGDTELDIASGGGRIEATFDAAPSDVRIRSGGGDIRVEIPRTDAAYRLEATSNGGSSRITVRTDVDSARVIDVNSDGGTLQVLAR